MHLPNELGRRKNDPKKGTCLITFSDIAETEGGGGLAGASVSAVDVPLMGSLLSLVDGTAVSDDAILFPFNAL